MEGNVVNTELPGFGVTVRRFSEYARVQEKSAMIQTVLGSNIVANVFLSFLFFSVLFFSFL
jgi:hypothetical protein